MNRRRSLVTAALLAATMLAGSAAIGINIGLLTSPSRNSSVGEVRANELVPVTARTDGYDLVPVSDPAGTIGTIGTIATQPTDVPNATSDDADGHDKDHHDDDHGDHKDHDDDDD